MENKLIGRIIKCFDEVDSTNTIADELAKKGAPEGTVVLADCQTRGQGRLERRWISPPNKGLWFSVILRPQAEPSAAVQLTLLAAVATALGIESYSGIRPEIKWPNDLLCAGNKICGILVGMEAGETIDHIIIGIGINTNMTLEDLGPELQEKATSLWLETGQLVVGPELLDAVLAQLNCWYFKWLAEGFGPVHAAWNRLNGTIGRSIKVDCGDVQYYGQAVSIDKVGALILREADGGEKKFDFGEVSIRNLKSPLDQHIVSQQER